MNEPKFILSKKVVKEQVKILENLGLKVSYSYKTNQEVGDILQEISDCDFSIHAEEEIDKIKDKSKISFFTQAESEDELKRIFEKGIRSFVVDNEIDLRRLLKVIQDTKTKVNLSLRMKFQEHRIETGKYFVYGMSSRKINELVKEIRNNEFIDNLGVHIHRKSQNTSEWEIEEDLKDSLEEEVLHKLDILNIGGGLPSKYKNCPQDVLQYVFDKLNRTKEFLDKYNIKTIIEPGRFIAAPAIKLETEIIQVQGRNLIINTTIYNCALDTLIGQHKMLIEGELEEGEDFLIKGNSPTRDDIFRYRVKLKNPKVGDKLVFLNAGAYNYTTDFFGHKKLNTEILEDF